MKNFYTLFPSAPDNLCAQFGTNRRLLLSAGENPDLLSPADQGFVSPPFTVSPDPSPYPSAMRNISLPTLTRRNGATFAIPPTLTSALFSMTSIPSHQTASTLFPTYRFRLRFLRTA